MCNFNDRIKNAQVIELDKSPKTLEGLIHWLCKQLEIKSKSAEKENLTKIVKTVIYSERDKLRNLDEQDRIDAKKYREIKQLLK